MVLSGVDLSARLRDAEETVAEFRKRSRLQDAERAERFKKGEPNIDRAVANLWGALTDEGTLGRNQSLDSIEKRILAALMALHAWPKDSRRWGVEE